MGSKSNKIPRCMNCKFYRKKYDCEVCNGDGWCKEGLWQGKVKIKDVYSVKKNDTCIRWVDASTPEDVRNTLQHIERRNGYGSKRKERNR